MSFVIAAPDMLTGAATNLVSIGSSISGANAAAAAHTTGVMAAATDEVSAAVSALFGTYGRQFQALSVQVGLFHEQFVTALGSGGLAYAAAERHRGTRRLVGHTRGHRRGRGSRYRRALIHIGKPVRDREPLRRRRTDGGYGG